MEAIPKSIEEWKICIEKKCGIPLTLQFAERRLCIYSDRNLPETQRFVRLYGIEHLSNIRGWLLKVIEEKQYGK